MRRSAARRRVPRPRHRLPRRRPLRRGRRHRGRAGFGIRITVEGEGAGVVPDDESNLAWQAADLVAEAPGVQPDVALHLRKAIPVAGGMAGGSADGAAALVACDALWSGGLAREDFLALAAALGSDVPFAYHGGTALGTGRGDRLTSVLARGRYSWVFAVAAGGLSTPEVYRECDLLRGGGADIPAPEVPEDLMAALRSGDAASVGAVLVNDLQPAALALRPSLRQVLETGHDYGALGSIVSGSGPTCAFLARDTDHASTSRSRCRRRVRAEACAPRRDPSPAPVSSTRRSRLNGLRVDRYRGHPRGGHDRLRHAHAARRRDRRGGRGRARRCRGAQRRRQDHARARARGRTRAASRGGWSAPGTPPSACWARATTSIPGRRWPTSCSATADRPRVGLRPSDARCRRVACSADWTRPRTAWASAPWSAR